MIDRRLGEIFTYDMLKLQVVEADSCRDCFFMIPEENECTAKLDLIGRCCSFDRYDEKSIIFVKVGEVKEV